MPLDDTLSHFVDKIVLQLPTPEDRYFVHNYQSIVDGKPKIVCELIRPSINVLCEPLLGRFDREAGKLIMPPLSESVALCRRALGIIYRHREDVWHTAGDLLTLAMYRFQISTGNLLKVDVPFYCVLLAVRPALLYEEVILIAERMPGGTWIQDMLFQIAEELRRSQIHVFEEEGELVYAAQ